jgi:hypothetical protein
LALVDIYCPLSYYLLAQGDFMSEFDGRKASEDTTPVIRMYEGIGELIVGGSDANKVIFTTLCLLNNPQVNQFLLDNRLRLKDRITKTIIFPRDGMALPNGQTYVSPKVEELTLPSQDVTEDA